MAATGKILGTVTSVVGEAKATAADGTVRILQVGDTVRSDETITTSAAGGVNIALENGKTLDCGANTDLSLHESILGVSTAATSPGVTGTPAAPGSVEALQQAIASGQDPSQVAPATAAGGAPAAGGAGGDGSGGSPVVIEQANTAGVVEAGFPTAGGSIAFPTPEFNLFPPNEEEPEVSVSVQVQVQVQVQVNVDVSVQAGVEVLNGPAEGGVFAVSASGDAVSLLEGSLPGTNVVPFVITLSEVFDTDVQVTYQIVSGTAQTPSDYFGVLTATITIPAGQSSFTVPIDIVRDHVVEGNETFSIVLVSATNATINPDMDTASVTIFNDDAPPVANNDTNWTQEDVAVVATGNVVNNVAHPGDPSAALSFADAADTDNFETPTVTDPRTEERATGKLELAANGEYTFTLNNSSAAVQGLDSGETLTETFNYTITDGFNAPDSATLTVTIFGSNDVPEITVKTGGEIFAQGAQGTVDEAALNPNGSNPGSNAEFVTGNFKVADTDGVDDIQTVTINGQTVAVGNLVGAVFHGSAGDMTVTAYADGVASFSYQLLHAVTHNQANQTPPDVFTLTASDGTSNSAPANVTINILDDVPSTQVTASPATSALTVDETDLGTNDTANFAGDFAGGSSFGADGPGSVSDATYTLSINNGPTGLIDTATGNLVTLAMSGDVVEGRVDNGDGFFVVFTVSVNGSGDVTLDQKRAVVHADTSNHDDSTSLASANLVVLTRSATVTDADGDTANASASINIGQALNFEDDGPSIDVSLKDVATDPLAVDETALNDSDSTSASANFADNFNSSPDFGEDGAGSTSPSFALSVNAGDSGLVDTGTDQAVVLSLTLGGVVEGRTATSGDLVFTMSVDGAGSVTLTQFRAVVHADDTNPDDATGLNSGLVILTRTDTVTDKDGDTATDSASIDVGSAVSFDDDGPTLTVTAGAATGLALNVDETDDAPGTDRYNTGEAADNMNPDGNAGTAGLGTVTTLVAGGLTTLFTVGGDAGADGQASQTGTMSFVFTAPGPLATTLSATNGGAISLVLANSTTIQGKDAAGTGDVVFTIQIVDVGSGELQLRLTQNEAINHGSSSLYDEVANLFTASGVVQLQYSVTRVDGDGDSITDADQINLITNESSFFSFDDDGPTLTVTAGAATGLALNVDETDDAPGTDRYNTGEAADNMNPDGNAGTAGLGTVTTLVAGGLTTLFTVGGDAGADGQASQTGTMSFVFTAPGPLATTLSATNGGAISLVLANSTTIQGKDAAGTGDVVFTIQIVDVGSGELQLRLTQNEAINHGSSSLYDEVANLFTASGVVQLQYSVTRVDGDGDSITDADQINLITNESSFFSFDDDGPKATVNNTFAYNNDESIGIGTQSFNFGSDGQASSGTLVLTSTGGLPAGYSLLQTDGDTWKAVKNGVSNSATDLFAIDMDPDPSAGTYTFTVLNGLPPVPVQIDVDSALSTGKWFDQNHVATMASNNVYFAVIEPSGNNPYRITASGDDEFAGPAKISVQNNTLGVGGDDTLQSQDDDVFTLSLQNTTGEVVTFTSITMTLDHFHTDQEDFEITVTGIGTNGLAKTETFVDGGPGVTITDLPQGDSQFVSIALAGFKEITTISTASTDGVMKVIDFDINFSVLKNVGDQAYSFLATVKDGDADTASDAFTVTVLAGTLDDDKLITGDGNQTVSGGEGNDTINGGAGNDILIGGEGSDTYVFNGSLNAGNADTVIGFTVGAGGDVLNFHDVLPGAAQGQTTEGALSAYVIVQSGTNTTISVDADGGGLGAAVLVVTLEGVNTTLAQLLNNNQIVT